jgi:hypothetical protein
VAPKKEALSPGAAWLRRRGYRHFDDVRAGRDCQSLAFEPSRVASHAFFPFISKQKSSLRYDRDGRTVVEKSRTLCYASHKDARVYAFYSKKLSDLYEQELTKRGIECSVTAYRKRDNKLNNIHFAKEAFDSIAAMGECDVIAADVSDFFGTLDHERLKRRWCELLGTSRLPADDFNIFRSITDFRFVDLDVLLKELRIASASLSQNSVPGKRAARLGSIEDIRLALKKPGLVQRNSKQGGIPQGSPISAVLSNLYMIEADVRLSAFAKTIGGFYRRYSDDILLVVPAGAFEAAKAELDCVLAAEELLSNPEKLCISRFRSQRADLPLGYLGFEFDGQITRLRQRTLARFHQRMTRAVTRVFKAAKARGSKKLNRQRLYEKYSHLGRRNFVSYARRASEIFYPGLGNTSPIWMQVRKHWAILNRRIAKAESRL